MQLTYSRSYNRLKGVKLEELINQAEELEKSGDYANSALKAISALQSKAIEEQLQLKAKSLIIVLKSRISAEENRDLSVFVCELETIISCVESNNLQAEGYNLLGYIYSGALFDKAKAFEYLNKAEHINQEIGNIYGLIHNYTNLGILHKEISDYSEAKSCYEKALELAELGSDTEKIAAINLNLGILHKQKSEYSLSIYHLKISAHHFEKLNHTRGLASCYNTLANNYNALSNHSEALENSYKSLEYYQKIGNIKGKVIASNTIGNVYNKLKDYKKAAEFYTMALELMERHGMGATNYVTIGNLGDCCLNSGKHEEAKKLYYQELEKSLIAGNKHEAAISYGRIANLNFILGDYNQAMENYQTSLEIDIEIGYRNGIMLTKSNIGLIYMNKKFDKYSPILAEENMLESIKICEELNLSNAELYLIISKFYEQENQFDKAYQYIIKHYKVKEKLQIESVKNAAEQLEYERKEAAFKVSEALNEQKIKYLEQLLDAKQRELMNFIAHISQKTEFIKMISEGLQKLILITNGNSRDIAVNLLNNIEVISRVNNDYRNFHRKFMEHNQEFALLMTTKYPNITPMELKVCSLIRTQIGTKEIANILNVSLRTVESHSYSLRKKFHLQTTDNLATYLATI